MRGIYGKARNQLLAATRPVIVVTIGGEVTPPGADGREETRNAVPPVCHALKSVGHVVLGLVGAVVPALQEPQPDRAAFTGLMDRIRPLWLADAADAGRMQMVELNRIVQGWRCRGWRCWCWGGR